MLVERRGEHGGCGCIASMTTALQLKVGCPDREGSEGSGLSFCCRRRGRCLLCCQVPGINKVSWILDWSDTKPSQIRGMTGLFDMNTPKEATEALLDAIGNTRRAASHLRSKKSSDRGKYMTHWQRNTRLTVLGRATGRSGQLPRVASDARMRVPDSSRWRKRPGPTR